MDDKYKEFEESMNRYHIEQLKRHPFSARFRYLIWYPIMAKWNAYIDPIPSNIERFYNRGRRGYSNNDWWGIDHYLVEIIPPMLKQLRERGCCMPGGDWFAEMVEPGSDGRKEWEAVLKDMEDGFILMGQLINEDRWGDDMETRAKKMEEAKSKMKLLIEHFECLWD